MVSKSHIVEEIRRTAVANNQAPLGSARFERETGIKRADWLGKYWARWGDALIAAGFEPNSLKGPRDEVDILENLAQLTRELGHFPATNEIRLKCKQSPGFPSHTTIFNRLGKKQDQASRLAEFCAERGEKDVVEICSAKLQSTLDKSVSEEVVCESDSVSTGGFVYLLKHGSRNEYKIGFTKDPIRREGEINLQLPYEVKPIHYIETDDPSGIERYWHLRFKDKRLRGEWFSLNVSDVKAFKKWKLIY